MVKMKLRLGRLIWTLFITYYFLNFFRNFFNDAVLEQSMVPTLIFYALVIWMAVEYYFGSPFFQSGLIVPEPTLKSIYGLVFYIFLAYSISDYIWLKWTQLSFLYPAINLIGFGIFLFGVYLRLATLFSLLFLKEKRFPRKGVFKKILHPRYTATVIQLFGLSLGFSSYLGILLSVLLTFLIYKEVQYEDRVFEKEYPDYLGYKKTTALLFPGII